MGPASVIYRFGHRVTKKTQDHTASFTIFNVNVKENLVGDLFALTVWQQSVLVTIVRAGMPRDSLFPS